MTFSREHLIVNQGFHKREPPRRLAIMKRSGARTPRALKTCERRSSRSGVSVRRDGPSGAGFLNLLLFGPEHGKIGCDQTADAETGS